MNYSIIEINVDSGGTFTYDPLFIPDVIFLKTSGSPISADLTLQLSSSLNVGQSFKVFIPLIDDGGYNLDIFGELANTPPPAAALGWVYTFYQDNSSIFHCEKVPLDFTDTTLISGTAIQDGTITFNKLESLSSGEILVGNSSNIADNVTMSGDATISNTGVLTVGNNKITDAKIANGTAASVRFRNASGVIGDLALGNNQVAKGNGTTVVATNISSLIVNETWKTINTVGTMDNGQAIPLYTDIAPAVPTIVTSGNTFSYLRKTFDNDVELYGTVQLDSFVVGTDDIVQLFTLPTGYRPNVTFLQYPANLINSDTEIDYGGRIDIRNTGEVTFKLGLSTLPTNVTGDTLYIGFYAKFKTT